MAFQPAPNCAEVTLTATASGVPIVNALNFRHVGGAYDQTALDQLAEAVDDAMAESYQPQFSNDIVYTGTVAKGLSSSIDLISYNTDSIGAGPSLASSMPNSTSLCLTLRTAFTGRSARGRFYCFPATTSMQLNPTTFHGDFVTAMLAFFDNLIAATTAADWDLVVLSRFHAGVARAEAVPYIVTDVQARSPRISSQRRRLSA